MVEPTAPHLGRFADITNHVSAIKPRLSCDGDLLVNAEPKCGPEIKLAVHPKWSLRHPRRRFLSGTDRRSALAGRVALVRVKTRVLRANASAVKVKENVNTSFHGANLGLSGL
jgi:hypothetical protein